MKNAKHDFKKDTKYLCFESVYETTDTRLKRPAIIEGGVQGTLTDAEMGWDPMLLFKGTLSADAPSATIKDALAFLIRKELMRWSNEKGRRLTLKEVRDTRDEEDIVNAEMAEHIIRRINEGTLPESFAKFTKEKPFRFELKGNRKVEWPKWKDREADGGEFWFAFTVRFWLQKPKVEEGWVHVEETHPALLSDNHPVVFVPKKPKAA